MLFPYNRSVEIYRCPADKVPVNGANIQRVRSYSLNGMMGDNADPGGINGGMWVHPGIREHLKLTEVINPGPSGASFFIDEHLIDSLFLFKSFPDLPNWHKNCFYRTLEYVPSGPPCIGPCRWR